MKSKNKKAIRITVFVTALISMVISIFHMVTWMITHMMIKGIRAANPSEFDSKEAVSIGIIGSADGPTSILLASQGKGSNFIYIVLFIIGILGCLYLIVTGNRKGRV